MYRVLLLEDSKECQTVIEKALSAPDIQLVKAETIAQAATALKEINFDIALLDIVLPDGEGFQIFDQIKKTMDIPVFFLTSIEEIDTKLAAFESGADDYLVKPVNPLEIRARVIMRLKKNKQAAGATLQKGDLQVDMTSMKAFMNVNGNPQDLELTGKELKILVNLLKSEGQVQSRSDLVKTIWGEGVHVLSRTIDSHVCSLRKKMGSYGPCIESIPKVGYRFSLDLREK